ncbi:MAG: DUF4160 domain-containing protein [Pacificimonas sp.]|jgi:hypothetical protein|nr:DUF4160 domain-containing protein [Pacificimonas sp.]
MPVISIFFGIIIRMYHADHNPPHFHASYQGFEALIHIRSGAVLAGKLPRKAFRIVDQWRLDRQDELLDNWQRGIDLMPMEMIAGADLDD